MMDRREFTGSLTLALLAAPLAAEAQQAGTTAPSRRWPGSARAMTKDRAGGVLILTSSMFYAERTRIAEAF